MDRLRITPQDRSALLVRCCRCEVGERCWDHIAGKPYCPSCQESLVQGETDPLIERAEGSRCAICDRGGTLRYLTFPLNAPTPLEMDLCAEHLRNLLGRRLGPHAFFQLRRQLQTMKLEAEDIFLLHSAFYDTSGKALRPVVETE